MPWHGLAQRALHPSNLLSNQHMHVCEPAVRFPEAKYCQGMLALAPTVQRMCIQPLQFSIHHLQEPRTALQQGCSLTTLLQEETPFLQMPMVPMLVQTQSAMMILQMCSYCFICLCASVSIDKELLSYISVYVHVVYSI